MGAERFWRRSTKLNADVGARGELFTVEPQLCGKSSLAFPSIGTVAPIDIKANEEGLQTFVLRHPLSLQTFSADQLNAVANLPNPSPSALHFIGAQGVAEPAALLAAGTRRLLVEKVKVGRVTVAIAEIQTQR